MKKLFFILLLITIGSIHALPQQQDDNSGDAPAADGVKEKDKSGIKKIHTIGELIVSDKKIVPGVIRSIDSETIENSTRTDAVGLIKENVPSFHSGSNRIMGYGVAGSGSASMSLRGIGVSSWTPQTGSGPSIGIPVLINGLDAGMMINNHPVADIFSMKNIERIDILHGPQPVLYGSSAMGGIVNIVTKRQTEDGFFTKISGSYGSFNTTDDYVMHSGKLGAFDYASSYNFRYSGGDREQVISGTKFTSEYKSHNGTGHLGYALNSEWYTCIDAYGMDLVINDPGAVGETDNTLERFNIKRGGFAYQIGNTYDKLEGSLQLYGNFGKHRSIRTATGTDIYNSQDSMLGAKLRETLKLDTGTAVTAGSEFRRYGGRAENLSTGYIYTDDKYIQETSLFSLIEQYVYKKSLLVSGGGRYSFNSESGSYGSWQGGSVFYPDETSKVHFQSARGYKVPDIIQYFNKWMPGDKTILETGTDLKAETYTSIELGAEKEFLDKITASLTLYRIYTDNRFTKVITGPGQTEWKNSDKFNYNGVEASVGYKPVRDLLFSAGYSYIQNEFEGRKLPFVPEHKALLSAAGTRKGFTVSVNCEYVYNIFANESVKTYSYTVPLKKLDNYFTMNGKIKYRFLDRYEVFADFNNITDAEYAAFAIYKTPPANRFLEYPATGFNWRAGASAEF